MQISKSKPKKISILCTFKNNKDVLQYIPLLYIYLSTLFVQHIVYEAKMPPSIEHNLEVYISLYVCSTVQYNANGRCVYTLYRKPIRWLCVWRKCVGFIQPFNCDSSQFTPFLPTPPPLFYPPSYSSLERPCKP
jgi:hypothetical protein